MKRVLHGLTGSLSLKVRYGLSLSTAAPLLNYEKFFKDIQKSDSLWQASRLFKEAMKGTSFSPQYQPYFTSTLRIMTRLMRNNANEIHFLRQFIKINISKIKAIEVSTLDDEQLKDLLLFAYQFLEIVPLAHNQLLICLGKCLQRLIQLFAEASQAKLKLYTPILFSSLKLAHIYYPSLQAPLLQLSLQQLKISPDWLTTDTLTLANLLSILSDTFVHSQQYASVLAKVLKQMDRYLLSGVYEDGTLIILAVTIIKVNKQLKQLKDEKIKDFVIIEKKLIQIHNKLEQYLLSEFIKFEQRKIELLMGTLVRYYASSPILAKYYHVLGLSLKIDGQVSINPLVIVQAFSRHRIPGFLPPQTQTRFIKMMHYYWGPQSNFQMQIHRQMMLILEKKLLSSPNHLLLLDYYCKSFDYLANFTPILQIFTNIRQAVMFHQYDKRKELVLALKRIDQKINILRIMWFNGNIETNEELFLINIPQIIDQFFPEFKGEIETTNNNREVNKQEIIKIGGKMKYYSVLKSELFYLKLKLYSSQGQKEKVVQSLSNIRRNFQDQRQFLGLLKVFLTSTPISKQFNSSLLNELSRQMRSYNYCLCSEIFIILYPRLTAQVYCTVEQAQLLLEIYMTKPKNHEYLATLLRLEAVRVHLSKRADFEAVQQEFASTPAVLSMEKEKEQ